MYQVCIRPVQVGPSLREHVGMGYADLLAHPGACVPSVCLSTVSGCRLQCSAWGHYTVKLVHVGVTDNTKTSVREHSFYPCRHPAICLELTHR